MPTRLCVTGEVSERLRRKWTCVDMVEEYLDGALARFQRNTKDSEVKTMKDDGSNFYRVPHPGILWNGDEAPLPADGGAKRPQGIKNGMSPIKVVR